jgi:hypothetical protein
MSKLKTFAGALTLVLLASCGGSAKKAALPAAPPVSLAIATTRTPTSVGATTVAPSTVPLPSTTVAPTTTTMSLADLEKLVRQRHDELSADLGRCIAAPTSCDPTTFTSADSPLRTRLLESLKELAKKNWIVRENDTDPTIDRIASVVFNDRRTAATLKVCSWDSSITLQPNAGPNGEDVIVDDSKSSFDNAVTMVIFDGQWFISEIKELTKYEGMNKCAGQ